MAQTEHSTPGGQQTKEPELKRVMGPGLLLLFIVGDILGTGVYALTGDVAAEVGGAAWLPFLVAFGIATVTAFSYLELVTKYPQAAGAALYTHKAFGIHFFTFLVAFVVMCSGITSASTASRAFASNLAEGFNLELGNWGIVLVALLFMLLVAVVNFRGVGESVKANVVLTLVELSGLLLVIMVGIYAISGGDADFSRVVAFDTPDDKNVFLAVTTATSLAFFAMVGFEDSVNMAEETKDPVRIFPKVLLSGLGIAGVVYVVVAIVAVALVPVGTLAESDTPLVEVVKAGAPSLPIGDILPFISMFAVSNTALINMLMASRLIYGMARQHVLPPVLGKVHPTRRTPWGHPVHHHHRLRPDRLRLVRQRGRRRHPRRHHGTAPARGLRRGEPGGPGAAQGQNRQGPLPRPDRNADHWDDHLHLPGHSTVRSGLGPVLGGRLAVGAWRGAVLRHHPDQQAPGHLAEPLPRHGRSGNAGAAQLTAPSPREGDELGSVASIAQGKDHALQQPGRGRLLGPGHAGQHPDFNGPDRCGRLLEAPSAARREPRWKRLADGCLRRPCHVAISCQGLEQHVHRLPCHERTPRELGVRQTRSLGQQLEAGVVRHAHPERPKHLFHG